MKIITKCDDNAKKPISALDKGAVILYVGKHFVKMEQDGYYPYLKSITCEDDAHTIKKFTEELKNYLFYCLDDSVLTTIEGWQTDFKELSATIILENKV